jgi:hypothetical protein
VRSKTLSISINSYGATAIAPGCMHANQCFIQAVRRDVALARESTSTLATSLTGGVAKSHGLEYKPLEKVI